MPEYVYAMHDFLPENDDEVPFKAGERIEVIERDDLYGDGWWQGRNLAGKTGLFPQSYTAPAPPSAATSSSSSTSTEHATSDEPPIAKSSLQPLHEESETESLSAKAPAIYVNGNEADGEVMKATMTDVQKAIEQLGRNRTSTEDGDGGRSFSFASTRDERDTDRDSETDYDNMSDSDRLEHGEGDEGWHKGARRKLAEKARKAVEEAEKLEMMLGGMSAGKRSSAPPIEVEMSDESEGEEELEEDYTRTSSFVRRHSRIPEEDEDAENDGNTQSGSTPQPNEELTLPERDESEAQTATATRTSFPLPSAEDVASDTKSSVSLPTPVSPGFVRASSSATPTAVSTPSPPSISTERKRNSSPLREQLIALPSPTTSSINSTPAFAFSAPQSEQNSVRSTPSSAPAPPTVVEEPTPAEDLTKPEKEIENEKEKKHPSEWSVEEVIEWLNSKGFGQDVCEKFTEQEITGDVLLELDVNVLKNEIGIMAFGKRVRIANAIADLRRPPSVYSDRQDPSPPSPFPGAQGQQMFNQVPLSHSPQFYGTQSPHGGSHPGSYSQTHSRNQSQSQSHHSYPGTAASVSGFRDSYSVHSQNGALIAAAGLMSPESAPHTGDSLIVPASPGFKPVEGDTSGNDGLGLGLSLPQDGAKGSKTRPAQLSLSPSDTALNATVKAVSDVQEEGDEERAVASEGENVATTNSSARRRLFGRSHDSAASGGKDSSRHSKEGMSPSSPAPSAEKDKDKDKDKDSPSSGTRHARARKSIDNGKSSDRLSIFGGTFAGSLGKGRKPPPRYSTIGEDGLTPTSEKSSGSAFHLPRFNTAQRKSSSGRPGSSSGLPKEKEKEKGKDGTIKETRDPALLRKRTSSYPGPSGLADTMKVTNGSSTINGAGVEGLKPGQSILEQIGEPDHVGWMKKKSDRYNSWKMRYFVLKGPHMYCLRSDSHSETKIKGYINIVGYKVTVDENVNPGKYGFRIDHENDRTHYFSSDEKTIIRDWMKAIMKATIGRDYTKPVISSVNIPTIPLMVAQAMNPAPRPPSPTARDATQKALRRENPNQLSSRDARVLMGLPGSDAKEERARLDSFFTNESVSSETSKPDQSKSQAPPRPSREARRASVSQGPITPIDDGLIEWANSHLPSSLQITDTSGSICGGLTLLRLAEAIKGRPSSPPVPDSAFPTDPGDDKLDGLFRLFDFLLDNDVKMGSVSINDIRQGKREKVVQLLKALKAWEDKRKAIAQSIGKGAVQAGAFLAPAYSMPMGSTI